MRANQAVHAEAVVCRVLDVSASGDYARRKRPPCRRVLEEVHLTARIREIHAVSDGTCGAPRIRAELADVDGRRGGVRHVARKFEAEGPNKLWVADITYVPTWTGFLFLAVVIGVWSRRVVGWSTASHLKTDLVLAALDTAVAQRQPSSVIHHSDHGTQYTSVAFGQRCQQAGVRPSIGSVGDACDRAMCESFFASLECERLDRYTFKSQSEARLALFRYIEGWHSPHRRHSALDHQSPVSYERKHLAAQPASRSDSSEGDQLQFRVPRDKAPRT